jgi:hypothetical protein
MTINFIVTTLTLESTAVIVCTACFNILKLYILPTECVVVFHMVLTINSEFFPKQH